uniref:Mitochondrial import receptor subunit TOM22 homolog n=1 Tax=Xiphophorus couchianus TaxID=32473 RepID=A0A3B5L0J4_9TELE
MAPLFGSWMAPLFVICFVVFQLDRSTREIELGLESGPPAMNLGGQSWKFEDGQWITESGGNASTKEVQRLKKRNLQLEEENNLLKSKIEVLMDMLDETLVERLWGLTEMFPDTVRTAAETSAQCSVSVLKKFYSFSRSALWVGTTSFMILVLPVVFETERLQLEQQQLQQQRQILLGPNTAMSGGMPGMMPAAPSIGKV